MEWFPKVPENPCDTCLVDPICNIKNALPFKWEECQKLDEYQHIDPFLIKLTKQRRKLSTTVIVLSIIVFFQLLDCFWLHWLAN